MTTGNKPGDKAFYFCDYGFTLNGEKKHECEDGEWSGTDPTCESKFLMTHSLRFIILELEHCQCEMFANI